MSRLALASLVALVLGVLAAGTLSQDNPAPQRVVFLDMQKVMQGFSKRKQVEDRLNAEADALKEQFKKERVRIEEMGEKLHTLNEESPEFDKLQRDIDIAKFGFDRDNKAAQRSFERRRNRELALLYKDISREAQAMAEQRGYGAVLLWVPLDEEMEKGGDVSVMMATRTTLWRDDRLDISDALLEVLNNR